MSETAKLDADIFLAIQKLKGTNAHMCRYLYTHTNLFPTESGRFVLAALTNNFDLPEDDLKEAEAMGAAAAIELRKLFDFFIESRLIGLRYTN